MYPSAPESSVSPASAFAIVMEDGSPPTALARVVGELDMLTSPRLHEELDRLLTFGCVHVDLDLSEVSFLAAAGLAVLARADHRFQEASGRLLLVRPSRASRRVLSITGLDATLTIC